MIKKLLNQKFFIISYVLIFLYSLFLVPENISYIVDGSYMHLVNSMINNGTTDQPHYLYGSFPIYITLIFFYFFGNLKFFYIPIYLCSFILVFNIHKISQTCINYFDISNTLFKKFFIVAPSFLFLSSFSFYYNLINSISHIYGSIFFWSATFFYLDLKLNNQKVNSKKNFYILGILTGISASCLYYYGIILFIIYLFELIDKNRKLIYLVVNTGLISLITFIIFNFYPIINYEEIFKWLKVNINLAGEAEYKFSQNLFFRFLYNSFILEYGFFQYFLSLIGLVYLLLNKKKYFIYFILCNVFLIFFYVFIFQFNKLHYVIHFIPALCFLSFLGICFIQKIFNNFFISSVIIVIIFILNTSSLIEMYKIYKKDHTYEISKKLFEQKKYFFGSETKIFCMWCDPYITHFYDTKKLIRNLDKDISSSNIDLIIFDTHANGKFLNDRVNFIPSDPYYLRSIKEFENFDSYFVLIINPFKEKYLKDNWFLTKFEKSLFENVKKKVTRGPLIEMYFKNKNLRDDLYIICKSMYNEVCLKKRGKDNYIINATRKKYVKLLKTLD